MSKFIHETKIYEMLVDAGLKVPKYHIFKNESDLNNFTFKDKEKVVVKGLGDELWHKSDHGALHFVEYSKEDIVRINDEIKKNIEPKYPWIETMVCEKVPFKTISGLPTEAFVSVQRDDACGIVINMGIGGIHTESWAKALSSKIMMWPKTLISPDEAFEEFKEHWIGKIWLGNLRQGHALTNEITMKSFFKGLWKLADILEKRSIRLFEMNPVVLDQFGVPTALDGVGLYLGEEVKNERPNSLKESAVLNPKRVAIAGVSDKANSFGRIILGNLIDSNIPNENLVIIKPEHDEYLGIKCVPDVSYLKNNPVDILIMVVPAAITVEMLDKLCTQGGGTEVVYLVAGGIGDGADKNGFGKHIREMLNERRKKGEWTPTLVGPNSLGIVLSNLALSTLFISREKLPIPYYPNGNIAFCSQSGAFFITRISKEEGLRIKYGHCIGNQMDLKMSDFISIYDSDKSIDVIGVYVEGFDKLDAYRFAENAKDYIAKGKHIVLYKGGRSTEGMAAAAGHTGAMAGNYDLQKKLLVEAGVVVTESFKEFASILRWLSSYPQFRFSSNVAVISNAGFETVCSADHLGEDIVHDRKKLMMEIDDSLRSPLKKMIEDCGLKGLVNAANPLDITPTASDKAYLEATRVFAESPADAVIVGIVPLSEMLCTKDLSALQSVVDEYCKIVEKTKKPIGIVVDAGNIYDDYCGVFKRANLPVFRSMENAFVALKNVSKRKW